MRRLRKRYSVNGAVVAVVDPLLPDKSSDHEIELYDLV